MFIRKSLVATVACTLLLAAAVADAGQGNKGNKGNKGGKGNAPVFQSSPGNSGNAGNRGNAGNQGGNAVDSAAQALGAAAITALDLQVINRYLTGNRDSLPSYLSQPQGLPPGIAKNLARGKPLPPGIAKRYLPGGLTGQLAPRPGYEWLVAGNDLLLVSLATNLIVDIAQDLF